MRHSLKGLAVSTSGPYSTGGRGGGSSVTAGCLGSTVVCKYPDSPSLNPSETSALLWRVSHDAQSPQEANRTFTGPSWGPFALLQLPFLWGAARKLGPWVIVIANQQCPSMGLCWIPQYINFLLHGGPAAQPSEAPWSWPSFYTGLPASVNSGNPKTAQQGVSTDQHIFLACAQES